MYIKFTEQKLLLIIKILNVVNRPILYTFHILRESFYLAK